jgi:putative peptidoglycan lipid II flippase
MSQMLKSSGALASATLTSRILGMVREIVYARFMGDTAVASAFKLAFQIPNLFRRLLGEGALSAAFIPIFKTKERTGNEQEMWRAANAVISGLTVVAAAIIGLVMIGLSIALAAHPFADNTRLMLSLLRVMFPYMLVICVTAVFMGMLNARGHFFIPAAGAVVLNLVMIGSVLLLAPRLGKELNEQIFGLAIGVLVAGVAQAGFQLPTLAREGFRYHWVAPWGDPTVREVVRKMIPGALGVAAFQINVLVTYGIAFWVDPQIVASFDYAVRLMELPQGVFGISLATYLLPTLSGLAAERNYPEFRSTLQQGLSYLIFVNLIASVLLLVLAEPIIRLIFEHGKFDQGSTQRASFGLACLAPGLVAFSMVNVLARAFYALGDTQTPMQISVVCLGLNLVFALWLILPFRQGGLGIANTLTAAWNVGLLLYALRRKLARLDLAPLVRVLPAELGSATGAGAAAWAAKYYWERSLGHASLPARLGAVFVPMILAGLIYWGITFCLRVPAAKEIAALVLRNLHAGRKGHDENN